MGESVSISEKKSETAKEDRTSQTRKFNYSLPANSSIDRILFLQKTIGNQAVGRLIKSGALQTKLMVSEAGDIYEQEADRVADQVMRMPEQQIVSGSNFHIQRACPRCEENQLKRQPVPDEEEYTPSKPGNVTLPEQEITADPQFVECLNHANAAFNKCKNRGQTYCNKMRALYQWAPGVIPSVLDWIFADCEEKQAEMCSRIVKDNKQKCLNER